jgi:proline iminopeptidase
MLRRGPSAIRIARMTAAAKGADIFFTTRGAGPTCLVLSSIGTAPYERQMPAALDERLRLVFVDVRGSGRSGGSVSDLTFDVLADDLESVRSALGVEQVAVLGHSMLGVLALEYARRRPGSVSHAIVVGTPPFGDMKELQAQGAAFFEQEASPERKQRLRENLAKLPPGAPPAHAMLAQTPMRFYDAGFDVAPLFAGADAKPEVLMHVLGKMLPGWNVTVGSESLRTPLLIGHGQHDYVVPWALWADPVKELPTATLRVFEKSGHQPFVEEPAEFADAVADWMATKP